jgi:ribosomal-protein-alanine N-acetyltransferase
MEEKKDILIRPMEIEDLEQVCNIETQIFSKPWTREGFLSSLSDCNNIYLVVQRNDEIVGYCGLWGVVGEGQINNVAVKSSFRGQGIGQCMLTKLLQEGKKKSLTSFTLEVRESNAVAIGLYERLGFQPVGIRKNFYEEPREGAVIMWLENSII